jgi:thioredoxin 1
MAVADISESSFEAEVVKSDKPVVADMWASWCGPCRMYSPVIDEVSEEYKNKAKFVKINVDENEKLAMQFNVQSIPTTIILVKGKVKAMSVGALPKETLKSWLNKNL